MHGILVPLTGLEPVRYRYRRILSPLRLPIPSHRQIQFNYTVYIIKNAKSPNDAPRQSTSMSLGWHALPDTKYW